MVTTRKQPEIQQAAIAHCIAPFDCIITGRGCTLSISKGQDVYSVKSDSSDETYYQAWNAERAEWECTCPATKPCKHMRALVQIIQARKETGQQEPDSQYARETVGMPAEDCAKAIETAKRNMRPTTTVYQIDGETVRWDDLFSAWACTCQEIEGGQFYEECAHTKAARLAQYRDYEFQMGSYSIPGLY
jgi:hypothetical protein